MIISVFTKKIHQWCALQERSCNEVAIKLKAMGVEEDEIPYLLNELKEDGFVDEIRFARQYAGGKFRQKEWGKEKIRMGLSMHGIDDKLISMVLDEEIAQSDYLRIITKLIEKDYGKKSNEEIIRSISGKGYEIETINEMMENLGIK